MSERQGLRVSGVSECHSPLLEQLVELEAAAFGRGGMNEWFLPAFMKHGAVFVLWHNDRPIGVAECMRDWNHPSEVYLFGLSLEASARSKGWGRLFLTRICAILAERGFTQVSLTVSPRNRAGLRLYRRLKFRIVAYLPNEYGPGEHRFLMRKRLLHVRTKGVKQDRG